MNTNIFVDTSYQRCPDSVALSQGSVNMTFRELWGSINRLSNSLREYGVKCGTRVGILARNSVKTIVMYYAVSRLCAVFVPFDTDARYDTFVGMIEHINIDYLFFDEEFYSYIQRIKQDLPNLTIISLGDRTPLDIVIEAIRRFPPYVELRSFYGTTETAYDVSTITPEEHKIYKRDPEHGTKILRSLGKPLNDVAVRIADSNGAELPHYEIGEILVHTDRAMKGYIDKDSHELIRFTEYWFRTDDLGYLDDEGYLYFKGQRISTLSQVSSELPKMPTCSISVYPMVYSSNIPCTDAGDMHALECTSTSLSELYSIIKSLQKIHECLNTEKLKREYLSVIPGIIRATAYGVHLVPHYALRHKKNNVNMVKWGKPLFDSYPVTLLSVNDNGSLLTKGHDPEMQCVTLQEFIDITMPEYLNLSPMFTSNNGLAGVLSFVRTGKHDAFTAKEQLIMRLIAEHMCVAIINADEYANLFGKYHSPGKDHISFECLSDILSPREIDVLNLVIHGSYNSEIAKTLHISVNTVKYHLKNLFIKLGTPNKTGLVAQAYKEYAARYPLSEITG